MNQQEFDDKIRASLEAIEVPYDPGSWVALEKKMDQSTDQSVAGFDTDVRNVLNRIEIPYHTEMWNVMVRQLDRSAAIRKIKILKITEAAVILLLAFQSVSSLPAGKSPSDPDVQPSPSTVPAITPMASRLIQDNSLAGSGPESGMVSYNNTEVLFSDTSVISTQAPPVTLQGNSPAASLQFVPSLIPGSIALQKTSPELHSIPSSISSETASGKWFIAAFSEVVAGVARNRSAESFSGLTPAFGISAGKDCGKWGFETGIQVSRTAFTPDTRTTVYAGNPQTGFLASYTTDADATVITLPLRLSRRVARTGAIELRALAGIAAELVAEKNYSRRSVFLPPAGQSTGSTNLPSGTIPDKVQNGIFEGGSIGNNLTASAQFGLRIRAKLGHKYSIFLEPAATLNLAGSWGPDQERIDRYSVRAGVYTRL